MSLTIYKGMYEWPCYMESMCKRLHRALRLEFKEKNKDQIGLIMGILLNSCYKTYKELQSADTKLYTCIGIIPNSMANKLCVNGHFIILCQTKTNATLSNCKNTCIRRLS